MALPPELLAALSGGGVPQAPPGAPQAQGSPSDLIRQALDIVRQYAQSENDEQNVLAAEQVTTLLQKLLANEQKEQDDAMQGKASPKMLRSVYGG
jgi:hypothetical protein